jgi:hypothetical protein
MPKFIPTLIPQGDPEAVRRQVTQELNRIKENLAQSSNRTEDMNLGGNRVTAVADPGNPTDAVNLRYLKKKLDDINLQQHQRQKRNPYSVVFASVGTITVGMLSAPYIIMPGRAGSPNYVKVATIPAGAGIGAAQFNLALNGTNVLTSDIVLPAGSQGPVTVTNFVAGTVFPVDGLLTPVVTKSGGTSYVTLEVEIIPSGS